VAELEAAAEGRLPTRPPGRTTRPRAISRVHSIPKVAGERVDDVYLSLGVDRKRVHGRTGILMVVAAAILIALVVYFVRMGNVEQQKVFDEARATAAAVAALPDQEVAPEADAKLTVRSEPPGALVFVDWMPHPERTPAKVPVLADSDHLLRVELPGHLPHTEQVLVPVAGLARDVRLKPRPPPEEGTLGRGLLVTQPKGVRVRMAGEELGLSPLKIEGLPAGELHALILDKPKYTPHVVVFSVDPGGDTFLEVRLTEADVDADKRDLHVYAPVDRAKVLLDGKVEGTVPLFRRYPMGTRVGVEVHADGRENFETLAAVEQASLTLRAPLPEIPPQFGYLTVTSSPKATVYVGSEEVGRTPVKKHRLPVGKHAVTLDAGKRRGYFKVDLEAEELLTFQASWDDAGKLKLD